MKSCISWPGMVACTLALVAGTAPAQQKKEPLTPAEQEALLKKLATPGPQHKHFNALAGKWKLAGRWRTAPDAKWTRTKGAAEYKWILGRRFLVEDFKFDLPDQSFQWLGIYGYDNYTRKYTAVWVDNMGTNTEHADGRYDPAGKVLTYAGEQDDPVTGGKRKFKWIITVQGKDKVRFDGYDQDSAGKDYKNAEMVATRLQKGK